jgi:3-hydroxyisobutyrate dehydrogenase-like beta-hydroxyacid dehydrogenase
VNCAFLGLGVMGYPMAGHLLAAGHSVTVWNRTAIKSKEWGEGYKGKTADTIADAVRGADFVFLCLGEDKDVFEVTEQVWNVAKAGAIIVDHTTASSDCAQKCYESAGQAGLNFVDAPISGGEAGAVNGQLSVMCGGDKSAYEKALPIMQAYAKACTLIGPSGSGQMTKMINQICIAGILQGLSEGVFFANEMGLDMETVLEAIGQGAAQSWQMDNRALTMAKGEFNFGFAVDWMRKDLGIVLDTAKEKGVTLPLVEDVQDRYARVQKMGGGRWDTSSLIKALS